jgi:hypothetical protein
MDDRVADHPNLTREHIDRFATTLWVGDRRRLPLIDYIAEAERKLRALPALDQTNVIVLLTSLESLGDAQPRARAQPSVAVGSGPRGIGTLPARGRGARTPPPEICAYLEGVQFRFPTAYRVTRLFARDIGVRQERP